jgi:hypothetical protein
VAGRQQVAQLQKLAFEPNEFAREVLEQMVGGTKYVLLGKLWWMLRAVSSLGFTIQFPGDEEELRKLKHRIATQLETERALSNCKKVF